MSKVPRAFLSECAFAAYKPAHSALLATEKAARIVTSAVVNTKATFNFPVINLRELV